MVYKICRLYGNSDEDRQDLFQEIIIQLWKAYPKFRGDAQFGTWLYRIGLNVATTNPEEEENFQKMYAAIEKLNDIEKAIVMLYLEDKSYDEMEDILGISNGTLRVKMNRIKEKLRQITKTNS